MKTKSSLTFIGLFALMISFGSVAVGDEASTVLSAFRDHVKDLRSLSDEQRQEIDLILDEADELAVSDAVTDSLLMIHTEYEAAIDAADADDLQQSIDLLGPLTESKDSFLAADASFYLARTLMNGEKFEAALPLLTRLIGPFSEFSAHVDRARFYKGVAQAGLLDYQNAIASLTEFVELHPNAPERLRVAAWRQIQQLKAIKKGQMADVYQRMDYSRRKLALIEPGEDTQDEQNKIVSMLAKLIKDQEKKEASSKSKDSKNDQKKQQQQPQQQQANQNQKSSKSNQGGTSNNPNGQVVRKAYNDGPASPWSRLRDRSRDPANNAIKDKLPARYRDIVERYYEAANGSENK
ncbi:MAG: tetratricopeptide repeat protein [Planctomycetota bacterium]